MSSSVKNYKEKVCSNNLQNNKITIADFRNERNVFEIQNPNNEYYKII